MSGIDELLDGLEAGRRRFDELSPEEKEEAHVRMVAEFERAKPTIEQFAKEIEEQLKVSSETLNLAFDI